VPAGRRRCFQEKVQTPVNRQRHFPFSKADALEPAAALSCRNAAAGAAAQGFSKPNAAARAAAQGFSKPNAAARGPAAAFREENADGGSAAVGSLRVIGARRETDGPAFHENGAAARQRAIFLARATPFVRRPSCHDRQHAANAGLVEASHEGAGPRSGREGDSRSDDEQSVVPSGRRTRGGRLITARTWLDAIAPLRLALSRSDTPASVRRSRRRLHGRRGRVCSSRCGEDRARRS
jgi:hypothetical protein